jgi:hypothetical protein
MTDVRVGRIIVVRHVNSPNVYDTICPICRADAQSRYLFYKRGAPMVQRCQCSLRISCGSLAPKRRCDVGRKVLGCKPSDLQGTPRAHAVVRRARIVPSSAGRERHSCSDRRG